MKYERRATNDEKLEVPTIDILDLNMGMKYEVRATNDEKLEISQIEVRVTSDKRRENGTLKIGKYFIIFFLLFLLMQR